MSALFNLKLLGSAALALGISTVALWPETASANIVFDFSGTCDFSNGGCPHRERHGHRCSHADRRLCIRHGNHVRRLRVVLIHEQPDLCPHNKQQLKDCIWNFNSDGSSGENFAVQATSGRFLACAQTWAAADDSQENWNAGYTFRFTNVTPVPEPSTWAMMLIGFAGLGYAGHRASRKSAA
jgi:PEP-CTERM motif